MQKIHAGLGLGDMPDAGGQVAQFLQQLPVKLLGNQAVVLSLVTALRECGLTAFYATEDQLKQREEAGNPKTETEKTGTRKYALRIMREAGENAHQSVKVNALIQRFLYN